MGNVVKSVVKAVSSIFSGPKPPGAPEVEEPKTAPKVDDEQARKGKERELQRRLAGSGRAGTILQDSSKLG